MVFFHKSQTGTLCASLLVNLVFSKKLLFKLFTVWFLRYFNKSYVSSGSCWTWTIPSSSWKSCTWCPHIPHIWQWTLPPVTGQIYGWCPKPAGQHMICVHCRTPFLATLKKNWLSWATVIGRLKRKEIVKIWCMLCNIVFHLLPTKEVFSNTLCKCTLNRCNSSTFKVIWIMKKYNCEGRIACFPFIDKKGS